MDEYYGIDRSRYETTTPEALELLKEEEERQRQERIAQSQIDQIDYSQEPQTPINPTGQDGMPTNVSEVEEPSGLRTQAEIDKENMTAEEYGPGQVLLEVRDAIAKGGLEGYEDILTAPERYADMAAGEDVGSPDYKPDWNPLADVERPEVKTWWGDLISGGARGTTIVSSAILGAYALKGAGVPGAGALITPATTAKGVLGRTAIFSGIEGAIDRGSQEDSISTTLLNRIPLVSDAIKIPVPGGNINTLSPTYTYDSDHPLLKTLKNTAEIMGLGAIADLVSFRFGGNPEEALRRSENVQEQTIEMARKQLKEDFTTSEYEQAKAYFNNRPAAEGVDVNLRTQWDDFDVEQQAEQIAFYKKEGIIIPEPTVETGTFKGFKNKPIADPWQGNAMSGTGKAFDVLEQARRIQVEPQSARGSTDSWTTPAQAERMSVQSGELPEKIKETTQDLLGDERMQAILAENPGKSKREVFSAAYDRMQEVMGREVASMDPDEFWAPLAERAGQTGGDLNLAYWAREDLVAADLINAELFSQIRDVGIASREIMDFADVADVDGPLKTALDRFTVGMTNVRRSRRIWGLEGQALQAKDPNAFAKAAAEITKEELEQSKMVAELMVDLIRKDASDDTIRAFMEFFSSSNKIQNFQDLNAYLRKELTSGGFDGKGQGRLLQELNGVLTNSILSGPKTPLRAIMGTSSAAVIRPMQQAIGALPGTIIGNQSSRDTLRASLASLNAIRESVPESFELFQTKLGAYWAGDVATIKTRYTDYDKSEAAWQRMKWWAENSPDATIGDRTAFAIANIARTLNDSKFLTYSTKLMAATDDSFTVIMARARAREVAMKKALNARRAGDVNIKTQDLMKKYEDDFYKTLVDEDGNIDITKDTVLKSVYEEATLTKDLSGFGQALDSLMSRFPMTAPFFKFARTAINGLNLEYKQMPALGLLHRESLDIIRASDDNLSLVAKYGIETPEDLANAKALLAGRQAVGGGLTFMAAQAYMDGRLTGDGPQDRRIRQLWIDNGWQPRSIKLGDRWVSYDQFAPFTLILSTIANVGDNMELMGPQWAEQNLATIAFGIGAGAVNKSYLQGLQQFIDLFSNKPGKWEGITAQLINNQVPLSSLRNEIGKVITPYMREINSGIIDSVRNRNLATEQIAADPLNIKYDILTGKPLKDWDFMQRMFNSVSPMNISISEESPGRQLLFDSQYDLRVSGYSYKGIDMTDAPEVRSMFQRGIGTAKIKLGGKTYNSPLEALDAIAQRPQVQASLRQMEDDRNNGRRDIDPMKAYMHNDLIKNIFNQARSQSWASIQDNPAVQALVEKKRQQDIQNFKTKRSTQKQPDVAPILSFPVR